MITLGKRLVVMCANLLFVLGLFSGSVMAQCGKYSLYASDTLICQNDLITFRIHPAPPSGTVVNWDFDFKKVNNTLNPKIAFINPGVFTVSAEIILPTSTTCSATRTDYITIIKIPSLGKTTVSQKLFCDVGSSVTITNSSPDATKWDWTVGSSVYSNSGKSIAHKIATSGKPLVQLIIENNAGCRNKFIYDSLFRVVQKPSISIIPSVKTLCDAASYQVNPKIDLFKQTGFKFNWTFKGAKPASSSLQIPAKLLYFTAGQFDIVLDLKHDTTGCSYNYTFANAVKVENAPSISIKYEGLNGADPACGNTRFKVSAVGTGLDPANIHWNFGSKDSVKVDSTDKLACIVSYKYSKMNKVVLSYKFSKCTRHVTKFILSQSSRIKANFTSAELCVCNVPSSPKMTNKSTLKGSGFLTYSWEFMGKKGKVLQTATSKDFNPNFTKYGQYKIGLTATDTLGCNDYFEIDLDARPFLTDLKPSKDIACPLTDINLKLNDTTCHGTLDSFVWNIYKNGNLSVIKSYTEIAPYHRFIDTGYYDIELIASTKAGCRDTLKIDSSIHITKLKGLTATFDKTEICLGDTITVNYSLLPSGYGIDVIGIFTNQSTNATDTGLLDKEGIIKFIPKELGVYDVDVKTIGSICRDSVHFKSKLKVGGMSVDISADDLKGCLPFSTTLRGITKNLLLSSKDTTIVYFWRIKSNSKATLSNVTIKNPTLSSTKNGFIDLSLSVSNSEGCQAFISKKSFYNFNLSADFEVTDTSCLIKNVAVLNNSTGTFPQFTWSADNSNVVFNPSSSAAIPTIDFPSSGTYTLSLTVKDFAGCELTTQKTMSIIPFDMDFTVGTETAKCTPADYNFEATASNVDTFIWLFGDGTRLTSLDPDYLKIYDLIRIKPYKNFFDVTLIGVNRFGCSDTLTKSKYVEVRGPNPSFTLENNVGCPPLTVRAVNNSTNFKTVYYDYDDKTSIDSINFEFHEYKTIDSNAAFTVFKPFLIISDPYDCKISYVPDDSIVIYQYPKVKVGISDSVGCSEFEVLFTDSSSYATKWNWDFNNDGTIDDTLQNPVHRFETGLYDVSVKLENIAGCVTIDTFPRFIRSMRSPTADFWFEDTLTCVNRTFNYYDSSFAIVEIAEYYWDFGDPLVTNDISDKANPTYSYLNAGTYDVMLIVKDKNGCIDTAVREESVKVYEKLDVDSSHIYFNSVLTDTSLVLSFKSIKAGLFKKYSVFYVDQPTIPFFESKDVNDSMLVVDVQNANSESYCIQLGVTDKCKITHFSDVHCSVNLTTNPISKFATELHWTTYDAWADHLKYNIYRSDNGEPFVLLAELNWDIDSFIDKDVCDLNYAYYVECVNQKEAFTAKSNFTNFKPVYIYQDNPLDVAKATVTSDNQIVFHWNRSKQLNVKNYEIDRRSKYDPWSLGKFNVEDTFLIDSTAGVNKEWYNYQLRVRDKCNNRGGLSNIVKTILLDVSLSDRIVQLSWNLYQGWNAGVKNYIVESRAPGDSLFRTLVILSNKDSQFLDTSAYALYDLPFAYRVKAVKMSDANNTTDTSYSNIRHVVPLGSMFVPTAFTPNGDLLNDLFGPKQGAFTDIDGNFDEYSLRIFNRWGGLIFESNDIFETWDGTQKGVPCPEGIYFWVISAKSIDGKRLFTDGNVTLIR